MGRSAVLGTRRRHGRTEVGYTAGDATREADLHLGRRSTILVFEYVVQSSDVDADGVSVPGDALTLAGGSIADATATRPT